MPDQADRNVGTRERLLQAAGEVFAEKGFRRATVREIVSRAEANLNAVNYHFRDKQALYQAVLESGHKNLEEDEDLREAKDPRVPAVDRLHAFIRAFLQRALSKEHGPHRIRLMAMEMAEPTAALATVVERFIRPRFELLVSIIRGLAGQDMSNQRVELCAESIVAQCVHLVLARPIIERILPHLSYSQEGIDRLAKHVTLFSVAALENLPTTDEGKA